MNNIIPRGMNMYHLYTSSSTQIRIDNLTGKSYVILMSDGNGQTFVTIVNGSGNAFTLGDPSRQNISGTSDSTGVTLSNIPKYAYVDILSLFEVTPSRL